MNKKLLVMALVPVLVVMSGALAFSAFSGTATTNVSASAGYLAWTQTETSNYTYQSNTMVGTTFAAGAHVSTPTTGPNVTAESISVSDLAPGNWVEFNLTITNTGTVGLMLHGVTIPTAETPAGLTNTSVSSTDFTYGSALKDTSASGYLYNVSSIPSVSIDPGSSVTYHIYLGLNEPAGNSYQGSTFTLGVHIDVISDP